ncbi:hypothetical protein EON65_50725 [archaeon]|nr:MAG: hypothetical protein EON65_50725 [archaeon]
MLLSRTVMIRSSVSRGLARAWFSSGPVGKPRVLVVGAGWAGYRAAQDIDKNKYDVHVISPRNHFLFTPLLPSTTVGTLEFRAIQEPVRTIPHIHYYQSVVQHINFNENSITCNDIFKEGYTFDLKYDILILAPGSETNTLNVQGVLNNPNVFFLKQLRHARAIRNRLIDCFERASSPAVTSDAERRTLLTFLIVGGGPTNVEFASELHDFIAGDVAKWYPDLLPFVSIKLIEASGHILGTFNEALVGYVEKLFFSRHINLLTSRTIKTVKENTAFLSDNTTIEFGMMVWSTGIKQVPLVENLPEAIVKKFHNRRLMVDKNLRLLSPHTGHAHHNVFALGDCAGDQDKPLPALAQVASQQAQYIARVINNSSVQDIQGGYVSGFKYAHLGSMANVGEWKGIYDSPSVGKGSCMCMCTCMGMGV